MTLVIKATQYDNPDRYTVTTLTVTRDGQVGGGEFEKYYLIRQIYEVPENRFLYFVNER